MSSRNPMEHGNHKVRLRSLEYVTREEAQRYLAENHAEEIDAAISLAMDRNLLEGSSELPDDADIHQALYLLKRAFGEDAPSYDSMRVEIRRRRAA